MDVLQVLANVLGTIALCWLIRSFIGSCGGKKRPACDGELPPQPKGGLPFLGHVRALAGPKPLTEKLGEIADRLGSPVFSIRLGTRRTVVVSSSEAARECFTVNDKALATRPRLAAAEILGYNSAMFGFSPYGSYWRSMRKLSTSELLSNAHLGTAELVAKAGVVSLNGIIASEIDSCVETLHGLFTAGDAPVTVGIKKLFRTLSANIMTQAALGKRFGAGTEEGKMFQRLTDVTVAAISGVTALDMFPVLGWMDLIGLKNEMIATAREADSMISGVVEEHRRRRRKLGDAGEQDFMDVLLSKMESLSFPEFDNDTVVKATCLSLAVAGTETTSYASSWVCALLVHNPAVLKKLREELDGVVGGDIGERRRVEESDIKNLPYLQAVVKEALRMWPSSQFLVMHEAIQDCTVGGYRVPAGTMVLVNLWKIHHDPRAWPEPFEFQPERFLTTHAGVDVRGGRFDYFPFGVGRRSCPGTSVAMRVMHLAVARLMSEFDMVPAAEMTAETNYGFRELGKKAAPFDVLLTPRRRS